MWKWNIWQRPIRENTWSAIMLEGGLMATEIGLCFFLVALLLSHSWETLSGLFAALPALFPLVIFMYLLGSLWAGVMVTIAQIFRRFRSQTFYVLLGILSVFAPSLFLFGCFFADDTVLRSNIIAALPGYFAYCILLIFAGRFGAKLYDASQTNGILQKGIQ